MASQNGQDNVPDSWDDGPTIEDGAAEITKPMSALNVNAAVFTPGTNIFAKPFVPPGSAPIQEPSPVTDNTNNSLPNEGNYEYESGMGSVRFF